MSVKQDTAEMLMRSERARRRIARSKKVPCPAMSQPGIVPRRCQPEKAGGGATWAAEAIRRALAMAAMKRAVHTILSIVRIRCTLARGTNLSDRLCRGR